MALDDFDSTPPNTGRPTPEDEDLFNFPAADLGEPADVPAAPLPSPVLASAPASTPATPARAPLQGQPPIAAAASARENQAISERATVQVVEQLIGGTDDLGDPGDIKDSHDVEIERPPLPSAKSAARKSALTSIDADDELPLAAEAPARIVPKSRPLAIASPSRTTWLVIGGVVVLNAVAFGLVWQSNRSFRAGLEGLRDDLVVTLHDVRRSASDATSSVQAAQVVPAPATETPEPRHATSTPLSPYEETSLLLARQEIDAGEQVQARKRLYRLLAVADRIDADLRAKIEAQASYMVGDSYRQQAEARRKEQP